MKNLLLLISIAGCTQNPQVTNPTYRNDVYTVLSTYCASCHGPNSVNGNWLDYATTISKSKEILDRVYVRRDMPLGQFMPDSSRQLIKNWIEQGCVE